MADDAIGAFVFRGVFADAQTADACVLAHLRKRFASGAWAETHPEHAAARVAKEREGWRVRPVNAGSIDTEVEM